MFCRLLPAQRFVVSFRPQKNIRTHPWAPPIALTHCLFGSFHYFLQKCELYSWKGFILHHYGGFGFTLFSAVSQSLLKAVMGVTNHKLHQTDCFGDAKCDKWISMEVCKNWNITNGKQKSKIGDMTVNPKRILAPILKKVSSNGNRWKHLNPNRMAIVNITFRIHLHGQSTAITLKYNKHLKDSLHWKLCFNMILWQFSHNGGHKENTS